MRLTFVAHMSKCEYSGHSGEQTDVPLNWGLLREEGRDGGDQYSPPLPAKVRCPRYWPWIEAGVLWATWVEPLGGAFWNASQTSTVRAQLNYGNPHLKAAPFEPPTPAPLGTSHPACGKLLRSGGRFPSSSSHLKPGRKMTTLWQAKKN